MKDKKISTEQRAELHQIAREAGEQMSVILRGCHVSEVHDVIDILLEWAFKLCDNKRDNK